MLSAFYAIIISSKRVISKQIYLHRIFRMHLHCVCGICIWIADQLRVPFGFFSLLHKNRTEISLSRSSSMYAEKSCYLHLEWCFYSFAGRVIVGQDKYMRRTSVCLVRTAEPNVQHSVHFTRSTFFVAVLQFNWNSPNRIFYEYFSMFDDGRPADFLSKE